MGWKYNCYKQFNNGISLAISVITLSMIANIIFHILLSKEYNNALAVQCIKPVVPPPEFVDTHCFYFGINNSTYNLRISNVCGVESYMIHIMKQFSSTFKCYFNTTYCGSNSNDIEQINLSFYNENFIYDACLYNRNYHITRIRNFWIPMSIILMIGVVPLINYIFIYCIWKVLCFNQQNKEIKNDSQTTTAGACTEFDSVSST
jgi:hypothetical protein